MRDLLFRTDSAARLKAVSPREEGNLQRSPADKAAAAAAGQVEILTMILIQDVDLSCIPHALLLLCIIACTVGTTWCKALTHYLSCLTTANGQVVS